MPTPPDYYQVLQISPKADPAIVKAAYYAHLKTLKRHPDLGGDHEEATLLNEAYEVLGDPKRRRSYDQEFVKGLVSEASAPQPNPFSPQQELRRHPRAVFQNNFRYRRRTLLNGSWVEAQLRDISLSGACFRTQEKFRANDVLELNLCDKPLLQIQTTVRWVRIIPQRFGPPVYEGGVEFKKVDLEAFQKYLRLVGLEKLLCS